MLHRVLRWKFADEVTPSSASKNKPDKHLTLLAGYLFRLLIDPEEGGATFLLDDRNLLDYMESRGTAQVHNNVNIVPG
jgi:hypothetical protein